MASDQEDTAELPVQREPGPRQPAGASSLVELDLAALSHPGKVRRNNEDHFMVARFDRSRRAPGPPATAFAEPGTRPATEFDPDTWSILGETGWAPTDVLGLGPGTYPT